jgi:hypothetical protein
VKTEEGRVGRMPPLHGSAAGTPRGLTVAERGLRFTSAPARGRPSAIHGVRR